MSLQLEQRYQLPSPQPQPWPPQQQQQQQEDKNDQRMRKNMITGIVQTVPLLDESSSSSSSSCRAVLTRDGHVLVCRLTPAGRDEESSSTSTTTTTTCCVIWDCDLNQVLLLEEQDNNSSSDQQQGDDDDDDWFQLTLVEDRLIALQRAGAIVAIPVAVAVAVGETTAAVRQAELVGEFENGIAAAAWSPDGEVLLLLTTTDKDEAEATSTNTSNNGNINYKSVLLTLNNQWEVLAEVELEIPHATQYPVSMTWRPDGSLCAVSSVDYYSFLDNDDAKPKRKIRIYQRDTLQLHGVGRTEDGSGRLIPNLAYSSSHNNNNNNNVLAWAGPACSQLLATILLQPKSSKNKSCQLLQVAFLESNGLRHREFVLRSGSDNNNNNSKSVPPQVTAMEWNIESDLLAIALCVTADDDNDNEECLKNHHHHHNKVQLWHRSNYHWYLKHEFVYHHHHQDEIISFLQFHPEQAYTLTVGFSNGQWREYTLRWHASMITPIVSSSSSSSSTAVCVDGCQLQWTPLHRAVVPPPMYAATLTLNNIAAEEESAAVSEVVFSATDGRTIVVLSNGTLVVLRAEENMPDIKGIRGWKAPTVLTTYSISNVGVTASQYGGLDLSSLRNLAVVTSSDQSVRLVGACWSTDNGTEKLVVVLISWNAPEGSDCQLTVEDTMILDAPILAITPWADSDQGVLVELDDGQLLEWESVGSSLKPSEAEPLLEPCPWIAALKFPSKLEHYHREQNQQYHNEKTRLVFGKSARGRFYCHDLLLADSISSFTLSMTQQFLCYASAESRCQLRFLPLTELVNFDPLMGSDEHHTLLGYEPRNIERGSRLVTIFQDEPAAVLQMPRGNLETVYPRALVLRYVMLRIIKWKYRDAFETMRRQKVDLNLIVDMDPVHFLKFEGGAPLFIDQVQNKDYLNLFLSALQNWNSTQERYPVPHWIREVETNKSPGMDDFDFSSKVNHVCQRMRSVMIEAEKYGKTLNGNEVKEGDFLLPILSTFAKENPPKLEEALQLIKENAIKHQSTPSSSKPPLFADKAQHCIQYLAFLAEYELLFDCALGLYDYDIARAVARNSQMDPKMYLPLLKRYRELPEFYARYEVDMRLQRYERALQNLAKSHNAEENLESVTLPPDQESISGNSLENCMILIEEHGLHRLGLELFQDAKSVQRIMISLGDRMLKDRKASTALSVFLAAPSLDGERAMRAAKAAREWRSYFSLMRTTRNESSATEFDDEQQRIIAREIADNLAADAQGSIDRRELLKSASRILLDYGKDIVGAVDMLIAAEMWDEGQRIVNLYGRNEMDRRCLDAAISYAQTTMIDLEERSETFHKTMARYLVVLKIRKEAIASGEAEELPESNEQDETGSLFSAASNVTNTSLSSTASMASVSSLSSVISAKSTSSFSITGAQESSRHKSKFNQLGSKPKKKKKKKRDRKRARARPGSHAELVNLVETLRLTCLDNDFRATIVETITFLSRNGNVSTARELFDSHVSFCKQLSKCQLERIETVGKEHLEHEARIRREGGHPLPTLQVESEVESLGPVDLPTDVTELFALLPDTISFTDF